MMEFTPCDMACCNGWHAVVRIGRREGWGYGEYRPLAALSALYEFVARPFFRKMGV